jgi:hypothetical protein|nr:hypothetical protein [uncultured Emticicia sp.]
MKFNNFSLILKSLSVFTLAFGLVNCKSDKIAVEEVYDFSKTFPVVVVTPVVITPPAATTYTAGSITVSAAFTALATSTTPPVELLNASAKISPTLISAATATLTPAVLADIKAGKPLSAAVQKALNDLLKTGELNAFLPTKTLPSVDGKPVGGRIGLISGKTNVFNDNTQMFSTANACNDEILKSYNVAKKILDDGLAADIVKINAAYDTNIKLADVSAEKAAALKRRDDKRIELNVVKDNALKSTDLSIVATALAIYQANYDANDQVYDAEIIGLDAKAKSITDKANVAKQTDTKKATDDYNAKLTPITTLYNVENNKCHNQGG